MVELPRTRIREAEDLAEVEAQLDADLKANGGATKDKNQIDVVNNTRIRRALRRVSFTILKISDVDSVDRSTHSYSKDGIPDAQDVVRVDLVGGFALQKVTDNRSYFRYFFMFLFFRLCSPSHSMQSAFIIMAKGKHTPW
ncbi:hypothetical protein P3S68_000935 [Capsicum galapagoense]